MSDKLETRPEVAVVPFTQKQVELLKSQICQGASDDELQLFIAVCQRTRLDPFARQIHAVQRRQKIDDEWVTRMVIQTGIDGYRLIAQRTGEYAGQEGPFWCGKDGEWKDVWVAEENPYAAKVGVYRLGVAQPFVAVAHFSAYVQTNKSGEPVSRWKHDPAGMIAKCAEALALRKGFPQEMSGLYADVELGQADSPEDAPRVAQPRRMSAKVASAADSYEGCIIEVKPLETKAKKKFWAIQTDEPQEYTTFDSKLAELAGVHAGSGEVVRVTFETKHAGDKVYRNLTGVEVVS